MSQSTPVTLPADAVVITGDHAITTSSQVAATFGLRHDNVLRTIRNVLADCPREFSLLNFEASDYMDERGKTQPMYSIRKDGFVLLVMGFTGRLATAFKIAYLDRFNQMEAALQQPLLARAKSTAELEAISARAETLLAETTRRQTATQRFKREAKSAWLQSVERDQELARLRTECTRLNACLHAAQELALAGDPRLGRCLHYARKDLNVHEVHLLTALPEPTVADLLDRMRAAGIDPDLSEESEAIATLVRNGLVTLPPTTTH